MENVWRKFPASIRFLAIISLLAQIVAVILWLHNHRRNYDNSGAYLIMCYCSLVWISIVLHYFRVIRPKEGKQEKADGDRNSNQPDALNRGK